MFGPIDIDSLDFQTRAQILRISELTGVSRHQVVTRAIDELYRRVIAASQNLPDDQAPALKETATRPDAPIEKT